LGAPFNTDILGFLEEREGEERIWMSLIFSVGLCSASVNELVILEMKCSTAQMERCIWPTLTFQVATQFFGLYIVLLHYSGKNK
jgi:hypothetical protein